MKTGVMTLIASAMVVGMLIETAQAVDNIATNGGNWEDAGTWSVGVPQASEDIFIPAGITVTNNGLSTYSINSLTITGTLTHAANVSTETDKISLNVAGDVTVAAGGSIDADAKGYAWLNHVGYGPGGVKGRAGAGHGGEGSDFDGRTGAGTYGSVTNPVTLGSGGAGRQGNNANGSAGGGAIILQVGGTLTVDAAGSITANGGAVSDRSSGSGGSINIAANAFAGTGTITAIGGTSSTGRGASGGGRIALIAGSGTPAQFDALAINARGGDGATDADGGAGTIYLKAPTQTYGSLVIKNNGAHSSALTVLADSTLPSAPLQNFRFDSIIVTNYGALSVGPNAVLDLNGTALADDSTVDAISSRLVMGPEIGGITWPAPFTNTVVFSQSGTNTHVIPSDVVVGAGGVFTHETAGNAASSEAHKLMLSITGSMNVHSGAVVTALGRGYGFASGTGFGPGGSVGRAGAAHGGEGGFGSGANAPSLTTYGSVLSPVNYGSGCGGQSSVGSKGGGAIILIVSDALVVDAAGVITADGDSDNDSSTGAGGSVNITADAFAGSGTISARGGGDNFNSGGAGGGRIALIAGSGDGTQFDTLSISAAGGTGRSQQDGGAGTVYLESATNAPGAGVVIVSTPDLHPTLGSAASTTLPPVMSPAPGEDLSKVTVVIDDNGVLVHTADAAYHAMEIETATAQLDLAGAVLSVDRFTDPDGTPAAVGIFTNNASGEFDGVSFNGGAIVLVPIVNLDPSGVTHDSAVLRGEVMSTGDAATLDLSVFYGTTDGLDVPGNWDSNVLVSTTAGIGVHTQSVSGSLSSDTEYFYRFRATDSSNTVWASPSTYFISGDITISATDSNAQEGVDTGTFTITRPVGLNVQDLTVLYTISSDSAINGMDYNTIADRVVIPAGSDSAAVIVTPITDVHFEGPETVTLTLVTGNYTDTPSSDTVTIVDAPIAITWTGAGDGVNASDTNNWDLGRVPLNTDMIVLDGVAPNGNADLTWDKGVNGVPNGVTVWNQDGYTGTVTFPTTYDTTFPVFTIAGNATFNGGAWTHPANEAIETNRLSIAVNGNLSIGASGSIDVRGKGYAWLNNTGYGPGFSIGRAGAAHGGEGSEPFDGTASFVTYGSVTNPVNLGSGSGGRSGHAHGAAGGGAVLLQVGGTLTLNASGSITADGDGVSDQSAASGGSVNISATAFAGTGSITAFGGGANSGRGAAGGGRIALFTGSGDASQFDTLTINARGGDGSSDGGAGTIYLKDPTQIYGSLVIRNRDANSAARTIWSNQLLRFDSIITTNYGVLAVGSNSVLDLTGTVLVSDSTRDSITSRIIFGPDTNRFIFPASFTLGGALSKSGLNVFPLPGDVTIASSGVLTHEGPNASETDHLNLAVGGNLTVQSGGAISVKGRGYDRLSGPGASTGRGGAAHGGQGGNGASPSVNSLVTYGSIIDPVSYGSGCAGRNNNGSSGGGAIMLDVIGTMSVDGAIDAGGNDVSDASAAAGGAIRITAHDFAGEGTLSAKGGRGRVNGAGAGGGRIALKAVTGDQSQFGALTITAAGGTTDNAGLEDPAAGTVHLMASGQGRLLVDNAGETIDVYTAIPPHTNRVAGELASAFVILTNGGAVVSTADTSIGDLLIYTNSLWMLGAWTLNVDSIEHNLEDTETSDPGAQIAHVDHYDQIRWRSEGILLLIK